MIRSTETLGGTKGQSGDTLTKPHDAGGLNLDRISSSIVIAVVMVLIVAATAKRERISPWRPDDGRRGVSEPFPGYRRTHAAVFMNMRPGTVAAAVCIVVVGFAIGAWFAIRTRGPVEQAQRVTVASSTVAAPPVRTMAPRTIAPYTIAPRTMVPRPASTPEPTSTPTALATVAPTATIAPTAAPAQGTAAVADAALQGSWQIDEANAQVGTIRWVGDVEPARGDAMMFTVHKQSVGGRAAMPCERQTVLRAAFARGVAQQTVPYREVNCDGIVSTGEVRVTSFSGASFSGSFWRNGVNLGNFSASKL